MSEERFNAMVLRQQDGETRAAIEQLTDADLPEGDVLVDVDYSSINYKDAMAVTGNGKIVRAWPMVPGIDLAGTVRESESPRFSPGDQVVLTGWGVGERYWGGYTQRQRVRSDWLVPLPRGLDTERAMTIGTAGLTAMLSVLRLEDGGLSPEAGPVLVTGATGGVGSIAVAVLAQLGYQVNALTRKSDAESRDYLLSLGAAEVVSGDEWGDKPKPLEAQQWAGAVDTVGGQVLARVLATTDYGGSVACCGLAGGPDLPTTVMPFILRGVSLLGVESVACPLNRRTQAWERLVSDLPPTALGSANRIVGLEQVPKVADELMAGRVRGRTVVDVNA